MGAYGRTLMKASPRYHIQVMESALKGIDKQLDRIPNDELTDPIIEMCSIIGWWRQGLIYPHEVKP